jgi:hypothetical protein
MNERRAEIQPTRKSGKKGSQGARRVSGTPKYCDTTYAFIGFYVFRHRRLRLLATGGFLAYIDGTPVAEGT